MSFGPRDLARALAPSEAPSPLRQGVVTAVNAGPPASVDVRLGSATTATPKVRYLASYAPSVGHTVWLLLLERDAVVLGRLA